MSKVNLKKFDFKKAGKELGKSWERHNQTILAIVSGVAAVMAVVESIRASTRASEIKAERKGSLEKLDSDLQNDLITTEEFKKKTREVNWQSAKDYACCYGTTAACLVLSVGSTACGYKISIGKQAALITAYKTLEAKSGEFVDKAREILGDKKIDEIKTGIVKDHIKEADIPESIKAPEYETNEEGKYVAKQYLYPCWDDQSGRAFMSSVSNIDTALRKASAKCYSEGSITLNEIYEIIDPNGRELPKNGFGETHGFLDSDLGSNKLLPYYTRAIDIDGYDHSFTALLFDKEPVNLILDRDY